MIGPRRYRRSRVVAITKTVLSAGSMAVLHAAEAAAAMVDLNKGPGGWIDLWTICDSADSASLTE